MVSPTLPGCPHHVPINETSMLIRASLYIDILIQYNELNITNRNRLLPMNGATLTYKFEERQPQK